MPALGRAHVGYGGVWDDGKGAKAMGRCMGQWEGCGRDREAYGAMGKAREGWKSV